MLQIVIYISILILFFGIVVKTIKIIRMPIHLRWELYPIPHEKGKAHYGGSYYEEPEWWTKPMKRSLWEELKEVTKEIFTIKTLYGNNRSLWCVSFPFHIGLYLLVALIALMIVGILSELLGIDVSSQTASVIGGMIFHSTIVVGASGWILSTFGAAGLLLVRCIKDKYRRYSVRADYFNLILLLSLSISGLYAWLTVDQSFTILRAFTRSLIILGPKPAFPGVIQVEVILSAVLFAYLPFTHMTHFVGKFFTFHRVRWQDEPNVRGSEIEAAVNKALGSHVHWSANHLRQGKSWLEGTDEK